MIHSGGVVMYIIILCSIVAVGFIIERLLAYRQAHCDMGRFFPQLEKAVKLGKIEEASVYCERTRGLIPGVLLVGLRHKDEKIEDIRRILIDEIQIHVMPNLQRYLSVLATIARGAPMLGLLGTVLGMIDLFGVIGRGDLGKSEELARGIGLALVTTAGGLTVAIPIIFIHAYFKAKIRSIELELYHYLTLFLRLMHKRQEVA